MRILEVHVSSARRANGEVVIPHGDTVLQSGGRIIACADEDAARQLAYTLLGDRKASEIVTTADRS